MSSLDKVFEPPCPLFSLSIANDYPEFVEWDPIVSPHCISGTVMYSTYVAGLIVYPLLALGMFLFVFITNWKQWSTVSRFRRAVFAVSIMGEILLGLTYIFYITGTTGPGRMILPGLAINACFVNTTYITLRWYGSYLKVNKMQPTISTDTKAKVLVRIRRLFAALNICFTIPYFTLLIVAAAGDNEKYYNQRNLLYGVATLWLGVLTLAVSVAIFISSHKLLKMLSAHIGIWTKMNSSSGAQGGNGDFRPSSDHNHRVEMNPASNLQHVCEKIRRYTFLQCIVWSSGGIGGIVFFSWIVATLDMPFGAQYSYYAIHYFLYPMVAMALILDIYAVFMMSGKDSTTGGSSANDSMSQVG